MKLFLVIAALLSFACNKNKLHVSINNAPLIKIEEAGTGNVNQEIPITITYLLGSSSCTEFDRLEVNGNQPVTTAGTIYLRVYVKLTTGANRACTDDLASRTVTFNFKAPLPGLYKLKAELGYYNTIVEKDIIIQ
ncbi:MAG TPA: hypothetical protein VI461_09060 [Chitinophagaceae bacterium]|nr:hypothetical protein [Chitinophagaceae bacterium]